MIQTYNDKYYLLLYFLKSHEAHTSHVYNASHGYTI